MLTKRLLSLLLVIVATGLAAGALATRWFAAQTDPTFVVEHEVIVNADAETVWAVLTDFETYPEWNPYLVRVEGELKPEAEIQASILQEDWSRPITVKTVMTRIEPGRAFAWRGTLLLRGLQDTEHTFHVEALSEGRTRFHQTEDFTGLLPRLVYTDEARGYVRNAFQAMNEALANRAEAAQRLGD